LYKSESIGRISDAYAAADECYKLSQDKKELKEINNNMAEELQKTMTNRQVGSISKNLLDIQIFLKLKAEKQRDQLKEEKKRLENCIADLLK
jgi:tRNA nucleotidyltransferase (CCA-adding enzyme)